MYCCLLRLLLHFNQNLHAFLNLDLAEDNSLSHHFFLLHFTLVPDFFILAGSSWSTIEQNSSYMQLIAELLGSWSLLIDEASLSILHILQGSAK